MSKRQSDARRMKKGLKKELGVRSFSEIVKNKFKSKKV